MSFLVVLELLRGGDAGPAVAAVAAVLPRVAAALVVIVTPLVRPSLALLALLLTNLVLTLLPLGRSVVAEGLDERRRPVGFAKHRDGLRGDVNRDEREHSKTGLERLAQGFPVRVGDQTLADAGLAQTERAARCTGRALQ